MARVIPHQNVRDFLMLKELNDTIKRYCDNFVLDFDTIIPLECKTPYGGKSFSIIQVLNPTFDKSIINSSVLSKIKKSKIQRVNTTEDLVMIDHEDKDFNSPLILNKINGKYDVLERKAWIDKYDESKSIYRKLSPLLDSHYKSKIDFSPQQIEILLDNEKYIEIETGGEINVRLVKNMIPTWRKTKDKEDLISYSIQSVLHDGMDFKTSYIIIENTAYNGIIKTFHIYRILI